MARIFPTPLPDSVRKEPRLNAEVKVYDRLAKLPGPYTVYYSVRWPSKNPKGRTSDAEADFVVVHPAKGVLVIEVKGGGVAHDGPTGKWFSVDRDGRRHEIDDPVKKAMILKNDLVKRLKEQPGWRNSGMICHAVAFPDLRDRNTQLAPDLPTPIALFEPDLIYLEEKLESAFSFWSNQSAHRSEMLESDLAVVERFFAPTYELRKPLGVLLSDTDTEIFRLTNQQFAVLRCNRRNARASVAGGAGTGKTLLAIEKAREFARDGMSTLFVCFNKPLADYVKTALAGTDGVTVSTFHGLCHDYAERAGLPVLPLGTKEVPADYFRKQLPAWMSEALGKRPDDRFNAVVVDEAQDIEEDWWPLILGTLFEPDEQPLWVFYDPNQRFYRQGSSFPEFATELTLDENLRNTKPIQQFAARFCSNEEFIPGGPDGPPVEQLKLPSNLKLADALETVLDRLIHEDLIPAEEIAILTGVSLKKSALNGIKKIGNWELTPSDQPVRGKVVLETIHRFKGLERQVVILVETESLATATGDEKKDQDHRNLMYVGCTRARGLLICNSV
ncbi:MAG: NERD domain-containing protein [Deltaproteobacteria bacterium]|nr:NERD domain-containing protein [Deltaproteobacteria bacterium]